MFNDLDELIRSKRSRFQVWRELASGVTGVALAGAGFQAIYSMLVALE